MVGEDFKALLLEENAGTVSARVTRLGFDRLGPGDVTVAVGWSTINYKDGLVLTGQGRLVKTYPHVPGIDFAGTVVASAHPAWTPGDEVVHNGWFVGERQWGGYAERVRVKGDWLVRRPDGLSAKRAMAIGTAGFTAMLALTRLEAHGLTPSAGDVLVTGAAGGVGSVALMILQALGYRAVASTGRTAEAEFLKGLGAAEVIDRATIATPSGKPLESERWAACIDAVGGGTLATVLSQMRYGGAVAACGLAGGAALPTTVIPFLLRGVALLGIDSIQGPQPERSAIWQRLAKVLPLDRLDAATMVEPLERLPALAPEILAGRLRGRTVIEIAG